jgi:clathrin heavy chain
MWQTAAKLLFTSIFNWARLATTLIYLEENQAAVESARKMGNTQYELLEYLCRV